MKRITVSRQSWAQHAEVYAVEMLYRGVQLTGLTKKSTLARRVIEGGKGATAAAKQLARDLKQQNGIYRFN
jgi:hypothetical protein